MTTDAPAPPTTKLTKLQRAVVRKLGEFPSEEWLGDKISAVSEIRILEQLKLVDLVESSGLTYRLTVAGRELADKLGESKFVQRQRQTIARIAKYWTELFEIEELRPAFHLAMTRILSRELRLTPDAPVPCICSLELPHNTFPHHCPAAVPRTIAVVDHRPDDVLLETIHRIGLACDGGPTTYLPEFVTMRIGAWAGPQDAVVTVCRDPQKGRLFDTTVSVVREKAPVEPPPIPPPSEFDDWCEHIAFDNRVPE